MDERKIIFNHLKKQFPYIRLKDNSFTDDECTFTDKKSYRDKYFVEIKFVFGFDVGAQYRAAKWIIVDLITDNREKKNFLTFRAKNKIEVPLDETIIDLLQNSIDNIPYIKTKKREYNLNQILE